jgi:CO/xanthine dehydrogenase Mo-binding subunit
MGAAIGKAAADLRQQLLERAAEILEASVNDLVFTEGRVAVRGSPDRSLSYSEIVLRSGQGNLIGRGAFSTRGGLDLETGQGIGSVHWHQGAIGCEVEVDAETGKIRVLQLAPTVFAGRVVNPRLCELQLEGSAIFGFGQTLLEEMVYDRGQLLNQNLGDYSVPSFDDIPLKLTPSALEHQTSGELHGIGETLLPPVLAAIGNAVYNAVGVRVRDLPITAEKVLRELARTRSH